MTDGMDITFRKEGCAWGGSWTLTERGAGKKKKGSFFVFRKPLSCSRRVKRVITVVMLLWINSRT